jgi:hypothetical protein
VVGGGPPPKPTTHQGKKKPPGGRLKVVGFGGGLNFYEIYPPDPPPPARILYLYKTFLSALLFVFVCFFLVSFSFKGCERGISDELRLVAAHRVRDRNHERGRSSGIRSYRDAPPQVLPVLKARRPASGRVCGRNLHHSPREAVVRPYEDVRHAPSSILSMNSSKLTVSASRERTGGVIPNAATAAS